MTNKLLVQVIGVVLTLVGILGFFNDPVLGLFDVNAAHNIVHLATGLIALYIGFGAAQYAVDFNKWFGVIYIVIGVAGFIPGLQGLLASLLEVNMADTLLHLAIGLVLAGVGFGVKPKKKKN